jgi:hypothetical protein
MPTHIRAQCCWQIDSLFPRDRACINPCFRHQSLLVEGAPEWQQLADDLAAGINGWGLNSAGHELVVNLYEIKDAVAGEPNRPKATKKLNAGVSGATTAPGEIALCLSFYGGSNSPRERGRLYLPYYMVNATAPPNRPSTAARTKAGDLVPILAGLGGVNVDWIVWSPTRKAATKVTNWFVDDEWDTVRRRGLKPSVRTAGTTGG